MAEKYDVGTPIGGERKSRRLHSPLQEMDGVDRQLSFEEEEEPVPATPVGAHAVTMAGIAALLAATLEPVQSAVESMKEELGTLKTQVHENEDMMQTSLENVHTDIGKLAESLDATVARIAALEEGRAVPQAMPSSDDITEQKLQRMQRSIIQELQKSIGSSGFSTPRWTPSETAQTNYTAVFGGFKGAGSKEEADKWLRDVLWQARATDPTETYIKGDMGEYNGIAFAKFGSAQERDEAVKKVKGAKFSFGGQTVWAKVEKPFEGRTPESVLFAFKRLLINEANFEKRSLWVDKDNGDLLFADEPPVVKVTVVESKLVVEYGPEWEQHLKDTSPEFTKVVDDAEKKLSRIAPKGKGKGKPSGPE